MGSSSDPNHSVPQQPPRSGLRFVVALTVATIGAAILARSALRNPDGWDSLDAVVSADAATALVILDDVSATDSTRYIAASRLGKLGKEVVPELETRLHSDSPIVRQTALMALGQVGQDARSVLPTIVELSASADAQLQQLLIEAAIRIDVDSEHTRLLLRQAIDSSHESLRREAFTILRARTKAHDSLLIELLDAPAPELRSRAIRALCDRDDPPAPDVVRRIEAAVFDVNQNVRGTALSGLERQDLISDRLFGEIINGPHYEFYAHTLQRVYWGFSDHDFRDIEFIANHAERLTEILRSGNFPAEARDAALAALGSTGFGDAETRDLSLDYILPASPPDDVRKWDRHFSWWTGRLATLSGYGPSQELSVAAFVSAFRNESPGNPVLILQDHSISSSQLEAVAKLPGLRAICLFDCQLESGALKSLESAHGLWALVLHDCSLTDDDLNSLPPLPVLTHLSLYENPITSDSAAAIARQSQLRNLVITDTQLGDQAFDELSRLRHLQSLTFSRPQFEIRSVARIQSLMYVPLNPDLTDEDVESLSRLQNLGYLSLRGRKVTDASLPHLVRLTSLRQLDVFKTGISDDGLKRLQSELSGCVITRSP
jgi:hypothetical protein